MRPSQRRDCDVSARPRPCCEIHRAPDKDITEDLWKKASCVAVILSMKKAAFIVHGNYGNGVMSCGDGEGSIAGGPVCRDIRAMTDARTKAEVLS
jgi:lipid-binding SYLF domain-containing protein